MPLTPSLGKCHPIAIGMLYSRHEVLEKFRLPQIHFKACLLKRDRGGL